MSKIALSGNASGTGTLTIASPNTSTDRTLTLPDATGTFLTTATPGVPVNGPAFFANVGANQTISAATFTKVNFNIASSWGSIANSWDATNQRFTATVSGYYLFTGCIYATGSGWAGQSLTIARINNGDDIRLQDTAATGTYNIQVNGMVYLTAGQYLDFYVYSQIGSTISSSSSATWIRGTLIRSAT